MKKIDYIQTAILSGILLLTGCATQNNTTSKLSDQTNEKIDVVKSNDKSTTVTETTKSTTEPKQTPAAPVDTKTVADLAKKLAEYKLDKIPSDVIICSINGIPITMGDYRRQFKNEQQQVQASLTLNPKLKDNLLQIAHEQAITLSADEKQHLLKAAHKMENGGTKGFNKMLSESQMTKKQFDDQVLQVGLACKVANAVIEDTLLNELINKSLLCQAAKENGFSKEALNKYAEISKTPEYKRLMVAGGFSTNEIKDEIITNELATKQIEKIKKDAPLTDSEISAYYAKNKDKFKHGPRIRLSQIFVSLAGQEISTTKDLRDKIKKENPKLTDIEIDQRVQELEKQNYKLAESLLERANKGEDFAALANKYSEDMGKDAPKNGGDLGFQDEDKLNKDFAAKILKQPVGTVLPEVVISPFGYHVFKITDKEKAGVYKLDEIKGALREALADQKGQQAVDEWLLNQHKTATVVISPQMQNIFSSGQLERRENPPKKVATNATKSTK